MADPFSIASGAVGIASVGFKICQGLNSYYRPWKAYDDEIHSLLHKVQGLDTTLRILEIVLPRFQSVPALHAEEVRIVLCACEQAVEKLETMIEKCHNTKPASNFKEKLSLTKLRLLYPFKRETLIQLKDTVDGLQTNLNTAVQVLQLYVRSHPLTSHLLTEFSGLLLQSSSSKQINYDK